ncbi:MAG: hypothetical protein H6835_07600 [Planctomycetes bacterium]|nr:hypothetical protein [Planctomycetota bacterium]
MTGVIWFVQVVHYPLYAQVGERAFRGFEQAHCARTTWVVLPPMCAELGLAGWVVAAAPAAASVLPWLGAALVAAIWLVTFTLQVPCHDRLQAGFDAAVHRRLVRSNWLRTVLWSLRLAVAVSLCLVPA